MTAVKQLTAAGLRPTSLRKIIFSALADSGNELVSAVSLYRLLQQQNKDIGIAAVYRVLTDLEKGGLVKRYAFDKAQSRYRLADHKSLQLQLVDAENNSITTVDDPHLQNWLRQSAEALGFEIINTQLNVYVTAQKPGIKKPGGVPGKD